MKDTEEFREGEEGELKCVEKEKTKGGETGMSEERREEEEGTREDIRTLVRERKGR